MSTKFSPAPTYVRDYTWTPPLSIDLDRVTQAHAMAYRTAQRGNLTAARELVQNADRHLRGTELRIDKLMSDDPLNNREQLLERCEFIRQCRANLLPWF